MRCSLNAGITFIVDLVNKNLSFYDVPGTKYTFNKSDMVPADLDLQPSEGEGKLKKETNKSIIINWDELYEGKECGI